MPTIPLESKVLVTGANGYIASWIVRTLLDKGYSVRGTVRSEEKRARMKEIFLKQFGYGDERLEFVIVSDMAKVFLFRQSEKETNWKRQGRSIRRSCDRRRRHLAYSFARKTQL